MCKFDINRLPHMCSTFRKISAAENSQLHKAPCSTSKALLLFRYLKMAAATAVIICQSFPQFAARWQHQLSFQFVISPTRRKMAAATTDHKLSIQFGISPTRRKMAAAATDHQLSIQFVIPPTRRKMVLVLLPSIIKTAMFCRVSHSN